MAYREVYDPEGLFSAVQGLQGITSSVENPYDEFSDARRGQDYIGNVDIRSTKELQTDELSKYLWQNNIPLYSVDESGQQWRLNTGDYAPTTGTQEEERLKYENWASNKLMDVAGAQDGLGT